MNSVVESRISELSSSLRDLAVAGVDRQQQAAYLIFNLFNTLSEMRFGLNDNGHFILLSGDDYSISEIIERLQEDKIVHSSTYLPRISLRLADSQVSNAELQLAAATMIGAISVCLSDLSLLLPAKSLGYTGEENAYNAFYNSYTRGLVETEFRWLFEEIQDSVKRMEYIRLINSTLRHIPKLCKSALSEKDALFVFQNLGSFIAQNKDLEKKDHTPHSAYINSVSADTSTLSAISVNEISSSHQEFLEEMCMRVFRSFAHFQSGTISKEAIQAAKHSMDRALEIFAKMDSKF